MSQLFSFEGRFITLAQIEAIRKQRELEKEQIKEEETDSIDVEEASKEEESKEEIKVEKRKPGRPKRVIEEVSEEKLESILK